MREDALIFARSRKGDSDFGRARRQQVLVMAAVAKVRKRGFDDLPKLIRIAEDAVRTDLPLDRRRRTCSTCSRASSSATRSRRSSGPTSTRREPAATTIDSSSMPAARGSRRRSRRSVRTAHGPPHRPPPRRRPRRHPRAPRPSLRQRARPGADTPRPIRRCRRAPGSRWSASSRSCRDRVAGPSRSSCSGRCGTRCPTTFA